MKPFPFAAILLAVVAGSAAAEVVVDQEYVGPSSVSYFFDYPGDYMAQTFTLRNTGQLTSVALQISEPDAPFSNSPLNFRLTRTNTAGEPDISQILATYSIATSVVTPDHSGLPMLDLDLRSQHVQVHAGDQLAIVLNSNDVQYHWNQSLGFDKIAGGKFFVYSPKTFGDRWFYQWIINDPTRSSDAGYRITVDAIPEPSATLLAALAAMAVITHRRTRD